MSNAICTPTTARVIVYVVSYTLHQDEMSIDMQRPKDISAGTLSVTTDEHESLDRLLFDTVWWYRRFVGVAFDGPNAVESLTGGQHRIIGGLGWGPLSMSEVASVAGVSDSSATAMVDRLIARGYVKRYEDPSNRRRTLVELSPEGGRALQKIRDKGEGRTRLLIDRLSDEEREDLRRVLLRLGEVVAGESGRIRPSPPRRRMSRPPPPSLPVAGAAL